MAHAAESGPSLAWHLAGQSGSFLWAGNAAVDPDGVPSQALASEPKQVIRESERYASLITLGIFVTVSVFSACLMRSLGSSRRFLLTQAIMIIFHLAYYTTNVLTIIVVTLSGNVEWLIPLIPVHLGIGLFCAKAAWNSTGWESWRGSKVLNGFFVVVVLGLMQGIHVKLGLNAAAAYQQEVQDAVERGDSRTTSYAVERGRSSRPTATRCHCKAVEALLEAGAFTFVSMYLLLEEGLVSSYDVELESWHAVVMYLGSSMGCISGAVAMVEIDFRTSLAVQQDVTRSAIRTVRHLCFRTAEFMGRILTLLVFVAMIQLMAWPFWVPILFLLFDYLVCITLLIIFGGREPHRSAVFLLGLPMLLNNMIQFVDAPGLSLRARRLSRLLVASRFIETICILCACFMLPHDVKVWTASGTQTMSFKEFLMLHKQWDAYWLLSAIVYGFFLLTYAVPLKRGADLHSAVADRDVETLERLLRPDMVDRLCLDVNRYGPDGRTPLHLAAFRGFEDCIQMLLGAKSDPGLRTDNQSRNSALHLAALSRNPDALNCLINACVGDREVLNAQNSLGDTALHLAAQACSAERLMAWSSLSDIDKGTKNAKGQTVVDCAFQFDGRNAERRIELTNGAASVGDESVPPNGSCTEMAAPAAAQRLAAPAADSGEMPMCPFASQEIDESPAHQRSLPPAETEVVQTIRLNHTQEMLLLKSAKKVAASIPTYANVMNCGLSSFVLSAGLGALGFLKSQADTQESTQAGVSFDDFETIKELGSGAFGTVSLVRHTQTGERFAMKTLSKANYEKKHLTDKAVNEQDILKTTRHPFIVGLHFAFHGPMMWALVMDYCPNGDFMQLLHNHGTPGLALRELARYCGEVILAIEHLHSIPCIFRDLKPDNVVIDEKWRSRLTDFGLAKRVETAKTFCGSTGYAAPEVMLSRGREMYGATVDLYSFGVTLWVMLTGGQKSRSKPGLSFPPPNHADLRAAVRRAGKAGQHDAEAMRLIATVTSDDPRQRGTSKEARRHQFFSHHLGRPAKDLLTDPGPFSPPGSG